MLFPEITPACASLADHLKELGIAQPKVAFSQELYLFVIKFHSSLPRGIWTLRLLPAPGSHFYGYQILKHFGHEAGSRILFETHVYPHLGQVSFLFPSGV